MRLFLTTNYTYGFILYHEIWQSSIEKSSGRLPLVQCEIPMNDKRYYPRQCLVVRTIKQVLRTVKKVWDHILGFYWILYKCICRSTESVYYEASSSLTSSRHCPKTLKTVSTLEIGRLAEIFLPSFFQTVMICFLRFWGPKSGSIDHTMITAAFVVIDFFNFVP